MEELIPLLTGGVVLVAGLGLAFWMIFVEPRRFRVRRTTIPTSPRPTGRVAVESQRLAGLKILHVTDTHFSAANRDKLDFLRTVARERFDFVFYTGDLIDRADGLEDCAEAVGFFEPRLGSFAVLGGHDYWRMNPVMRYARMAESSITPQRHGTLNPADELVHALTDAGVQVLCDDSTVVPLPAGDCAVVGLQDAFMFHPDVEAAWKGVPEDVPVIVLAHSPDVLPDVARRRATLAFFGHTHGGQVRLPFLGALVTRSILPGKRASGTFKEQRTVYTLNNGMGATCWIAYRLLCRPEVSVLTLAQP